MLAYKTVLFHQDSTLSYISTTILAKLHKLGFQLVPQPHFPQDLELCDFFLVHKLGKPGSAG